MASRARDPHLQLDIRHVLVCFLGIISSVAAQNSIPLVAISAVPEAQTTLPPGELKGTYIASDGSRTSRLLSHSLDRFVLTCARSVSSVFCAPGEAFIVLANYAACCLSGVACDFGVECNGSALVLGGGSTKSWYVQPFANSLERHDSVPCADNLSLQFSKALFWYHDL